MKNKVILVVLSFILCFSAVTPVYAESVTSQDSELVVSDQLIEQVYEDTGGGCCFKIINISSWKKGNAKRMESS